MVKRILISLVLAALVVAPIAHSTVTILPATDYPTDFLTEVALGNVPGHTSVNKFGRNIDCSKFDTATAVNIGRDIWDDGIGGATMWVPPTAASKHAVVSSAVADNLAGAGAWTIRIFGLDAAYALQQEDLSMHATNGQTSVNTENTYTMIYRMYVLTAGSGGVNAGDIKATAASGGTVTAKITALTNQTAMAIYQIPAATTGLLYGYDVSIHKKGGGTKLADASLMLMDFGGVWRQQDALDVTTDGQPHNHHEYPAPISLPAKSYVKMVANPSADAQDISAGFDLVLVAD